MLIGQKIEVRRFVWNYCLATWNDAYKQGYRPDETYIRFFYKCLKERNPWIEEVSARIGRGAVDDLLLAFKRFFKGQYRRER